MNPDERLDEVAKQLRLVADEVDAERYPSTATALEDARGAVSDAQVLLAQEKCGEEAGTA